MSSKFFKRLVVPLRGKTSSYRNLLVDEDTARGHWGSKAEFMLSCIGLSVGLGNLWRFPTLAYENGGAAFFIPYIILQLLVGKPLYFLELALGQYAAQGPVGIFKLNPAARGVGISMVMVSFILVVYYICIMAYTLYFAFASFQTKLPWSWCRQEWIERCCYVRVGDGESMSKCGPNVTSASQLCLGKLCKCSGIMEYDFNSSHCSQEVKTLVASQTVTYTQMVELATTKCASLQKCTNNTLSPAHFYFYESVIEKTEQMDNIGAPLWHLSLCLLLAWIIVIICLLRGVKSSGKVVYFTATFPYLVIFILLIKGSFLPGARQGVEYFLIPDWSKLADINVWKAAGGQMFFSLGVSFGPIITLGSYNKFRNNVYIDSLLISLADIMTSFVSGLVVFTTLGSMAHDTGLDISQVAKSGYGLAFVAYPEALSVFPAPQFWSFFFFVMLFTLGVDSEFAYLETLLTSIIDDFPKTIRYKLLMTMGFGVICYLIALSIMTPGGDHVLQILDSYGATDAVFVISFFELISIAWVYGVKNLMRDIEYMLGYSPHPANYWKITWIFVAPVTVAVIFVVSLVNYKPPELNSGKPIPNWAQIIGWLLFATVVLPIPCAFMLNFYRTPGVNIKEKLLHSIKPSESWKPQRHEHEDLRGWSKRSSRINPMDTTYEETRIISL